MNGCAKIVVFAGWWLIQSNSKRILDSANHPTNMDHSDDNVLFVIGNILVIVEYCRYGNLRSYLLKHKDHFQPTLDYVNTDPVLNVGKLENICMNFTGLSEDFWAMHFSLCMHLLLVRPCLQIELYYFSGVCFQSRAISFNIFYLVFICAGLRLNLWLNPQENSL